MWQREQREQQKARVEERRKRAVERQREEYHVFLEAEEKKKACRDQFETCIRALGLDDQAKNLADSALKARGLKLEEFKQTQVRTTLVVGIENFPGGLFIHNPVVLWCVVCWFMVCRNKMLRIQTQPRRRSWKRQCEDLRGQRVS